MGFYPINIDFKIVLSDIYINHISDIYIKKNYFWKKLLFFHAIGILTGTLGK